MKNSIIIEKDYNFKNRDIEISGTERHQRINIQTVNAILDVLKLEKIKSVPEYYENVSFALNNQRVDWARSLPAFRKREYTNYLKESLLNSEKYLTDYFFDTFPKRLSLFRMLTPFSDEEVPKYKHTSITGRLSIESGVNYLTMKKDIRKSLRSSLNEHNLYELDFKSCEPNLYVKYFNLVPRGVEDVYEYIGNLVDIGNTPRDRLKRVILSILYGANERSVSKISKINIKKVKEIKRVLCVDDFDQKLNLEYEEKGYIQNMFGRPILSNANLVNYWIQSSAVDYCCLAFKDLFRQNKELNLHAVIHDAVLFSSPIAFEKELDNIESLEVKGLSIPVEIKLIG